jgi:hypothetical protein
LFLLQSSKEYISINFIVETILPQFDFQSFSVQVFWMLVGFFVFYFSILKNFLSNLASLFKLRSKILVGAKSFSGLKQVNFLDFFFKNIRN